MTEVKVWRTIAVVLVAIIVSAIGFAQLPSVPILAAEFEINPQALPTSATDVIAQTLWVDSGWIANTTSAALTFTILDKQGTPVAHWPTVSLAGNSRYNLYIGSDRDKYPNGLRWSASGAGLVGYIHGKAVGP